MAVYLADKSALAREVNNPKVHAILEPLVVAGRVATCGIVDLEVLFSARDATSYRLIARVLAGLPRVPITDAVVDRSIEVQGLLAAASQHRGVSIPDLLIAACAEVAGLTVLHYDADFDRIAEVTGQPTEWVVPRGSIS